HLLGINLTRLMLIGDGLHPVGIGRLLIPGPLRLANRVEMVAVPYVEPEGQRWVAPFRNAIELAIEILAALEPEALVDQHLRIGEERAEKFDKGAVDERFAGSGILEELPYVLEGDTRALDIDAARGGFLPAMLAEAARCLALHHAVERAVALVAPHDAVDLV